MNRVNGFNGGGVGAGGGYRVYVGGINPRIEREDLHREFGQYGPVIDVYMGKKKDPMMQQQFAFVVFRYGEDADEAVRDRNNRKLCGVYVKVEHARPFREEFRREGFQRGGFSGPRGGFVGRGGGYGGRGQYYGRSRGGYRDHDRWNGPPREREYRDYQPRRQQRYRQSPPPGHTTQGGYSHGRGGRWNSRSPVPVHRRRNESYNDGEPMRMSRYSHERQSPEPERRHKKKISKSKRQVSPSPSPPPKKKSHRKRQASSSEEESDSSSSESRSPTPKPKKKKKKNKKKKAKSSSSQSESPSESPEYNPRPRRVSGQRERKENFPEKKVRKRQVSEEKEDGYVSSSSG